MTGTTLVYSLYVAAMLGAVGLYLAMPRGGRGRGLTAMLVGSAAIVALLAILHLALREPVRHGVYFAVFSILAVAGSARVVTHPKPVYSALYFVMVVLATAAMAVLAGAEFLGFALIIVYAGAILVTYVFVIMLAQQTPEAEGFSAESHYDANAREPLVAVFAGFVLMAAVAGAIVSAEPAPSGAAAAPAGDAVTLGVDLLSRYAISVELAGVLLLVAMIGALAIARKPIPSQRPAAGDEAAPAEVGRHVKPF